MLDDTGQQTLFDSIHNNWIEPELQRRRNDGSLPQDFKIFSCLVRLPRDHSAIVEFNNEISWLAETKPANGLEYTIGQEVYLAQVEHIRTVEPPTFEGNRVAFIFLFWNGSSYNILFDFTPNSIDSAYTDTCSIDWKYGEIIAGYLNAVLEEYSARNCDVIQSTLATIGLWTVPCLLPYPLSAICDLCNATKLSEARALLISHCQMSFLSHRISGWTAVVPFSDRKSLFSEALAAHSIAAYSLAIHALLPHIEGVVTDWIYTQVPSTDVPWRQESKTAKLRDIITTGKDSSFANRRSTETAIKFILDGPMLSTFNNWQSANNGPFPNRHVLGHGKYDASVYTEENSIKAFLMLDTLYVMMSEHKSP